MVTIHRALLALDAMGTPVVLATDSSHIMFDIDDVGCGTDADQIGIVSARDVGPGLWLWEGTITGRPTGDGYEIEPHYDGKLRAVTSMTEAVALFTMRAPEPVEDEHETPGT